MNTHTGNKAETWGETPSHIQYSEINLAQHRQNTSDNHGAFSSPRGRTTSDFSSLCWSGSERGILSEPSLNSSSNPQRAADVVNSTRAGYQDSPFPSGDLLTSTAPSNHGTTKLYSRNDMEIPSHCRIDELNPQLDNVRPGTETWSGISQRLDRSRNDYGPSQQLNQTRVAPNRNLQQYSHGSQRQYAASNKHNQRQQPSSASKQRMTADGKTMREIKQERVERNGDFWKKIDAKFLLPHLRNCLLPHQYDEIRNKSDRGNNSLQVKQSLWSFLRRQPYWWDHLETGLEACGYNEQLRILQG